MTVFTFSSSDLPSLEGKEGVGLRRDQVQDVSAPVVVSWETFSPSCRVPRDVW